MEYFFQGHFHVLWHFVSLRLFLFISFFFLIQGVENYVEISNIKLYVPLPIERKRFNCGDSLIKLSTAAVFLVLQQGFEVNFKINK